MATPFQEQVTLLLEWFLAWNECEQVVVLYSLLRRISSIQARFIAQVFNQILENCADLGQQEIQANDPEFVSSLYKELKPLALSQLLQYLPLLKAGNKMAKLEYLQIVPKMITLSLKHRCQLEECRQLVSYLIIHPAFSREELPHLGIWQAGLSELSIGSHVQCANCATQEPTWDSSVPSSISAVPLLVPSTVTQSTLALLGSNTLLIGSDQSDLPGANIPINLLNGTGTSWKNWTLASSSRDSGISDLERSSSISRVPVGRPLRSAASVPLAEDACSEATCHSTGLQMPTTSLPSVAAVDATQGKSSSALNDLHPKVPTSLVGMGNTPAAVSDWLNRHHNDLVQSANKFHHLSIYQDTLHTPLSPQSSIASSGSGGSSDVHGDESRHSQVALAEGDSGMRDVSSWLKGLRLHKYSHLFQNISYEEMLNLTEEWLEERKVTKGARNKILLSIKKLQERQETLRLLEKDLMASNSIRQTIEELTQVLKTPIKRLISIYKPAPNDDKIVANLDQKEKDDKVTGELNVFTEADSIIDGDLLGQITRLLGKICTQLLVGARPDVECLVGYRQLLDRSLNHQAFTKEQKIKMMRWKQQIDRIFHLHAIQKQNLLEHSHFVLGNGNQLPLVPQGEGRALRGQQISSVVSQPCWSFGTVGLPPLPNMSCPTSFATQQLGAAVTMHLHHQNEAKLSAVVNSVASATEVKQPLGRTKSAPIRSAQMGLFDVVRPDLCQENFMNDDIHASLDSLCISMTEHALSGGFGESA